MEKASYGITMQSKNMLSPLNGGLVSVCVCVCVCAHMSLCGGLVYVYMCVINMRVLCICV